jgi:hypothetical protein
MTATSASAAIDRNKILEYGFIIFFAYLSYRRLPSKVNEYKENIRPQTFRAAILSQFDISFVNVFPEMHEDSDSFRRLKLALAIHG